MSLRRERWVRGSAEREEGEEIERGSRVGHLGIQFRHHRYKSDREQVTGGSKADVTPESGTSLARGGNRCNNILDKDAMHHDS